MSSMVGEKVNENTSRVDDIEESDEEPEWMKVGFEIADEYIFTENFGVIPQDATQQLIDNISVLKDWNEPIENEQGLIDGVDDNLDFNLQVEFKKPSFNLSVGQKFASFKTFRDALKEWNIREGYTVDWIRNDSKRITARCSKGCTWRIHASPINQCDSTFQIKTMKGEHNCERDYNNKHCTSRYISEKYMEKIRDNPNCELVVLQRDVKRELMVNVSRTQVYKAKRMAKEAIEGVNTNQYEKIWDYCATVLKTNPSSCLKLQNNVPRDDTTSATFKRMFFSLYACKQGFLDGCRPVIGLDGCFLKGCYGGQLLSAIGRDGNDNMFPIAFAVVEAEMFDSWMWFLEELIGYIGEHPDGVQWTFISDRQKGLVHALEVVVPTAEHRFCLRHMYQNFKQKFKGKELKDLFWQAASAGNPRDFKKALELMEKVDPKMGDNVNAAGWLQRIPPHLWARSHFQTSSKCDILVNNLSESFNNYILEARDKPIIQMFEWIRKRLMERLQMKRIGMEKYEGQICPNIQEKLVKNKEASRNCFATWAGEGLFDVECGLRTYVVDLQKKTCTCRLFELNGIPCNHAIAAIQVDKGVAENYVHKYYSKEVYLQAYAYMIGPVPSHEYWEETNMQPVNAPVMRRQNEDMQECYTSKIKT